ncbi:MAG TPA: GNAT family N-acetyltransferase [Porticoccaceae bacterium]|nr:GNAT family N-acetyltransferase [Porticoccaceae bacterium]
MRLATPSDYPAVSRLIQDNFANDPRYARLSEQARAAYLESNSLQGLTEACSHPDNVLCLVATTETTGAILGFAMYRRGTHLLTGESVVEGKRVQIASAMQAKGLGALLLGVAGQQLLAQGFTKGVGYVSSDSVAFFERQGRRSLRVLDNPALAKLGVKAEATYMEWDL